MKSELKTITPTQAKTLLEKNEGNRPIRMVHAKRLAAEILAGRWKVNGDTICFNGDRLLDGQHRLMACVLADTPITTFVVEGLPSDVFATKDVGARRSGADVLAVLGESYASALSTALCLVHNYYQGLAPTTHVPRSLLPALLEKYPGLRESVPRCFGAKKLVSAPSLAAVHYICSQIDREAANKFADDIKNGTNLSEGDPVLLLREQLVSNMTKRDKISRPHVFKLMLKTWNLRRDGKFCRLLRLTSKEDSPIAR